LGPPKKLSQEKGGRFERPPKYWCTAAEAHRKADKVFGGLDLQRIGCYLQAKFKATFIIVKDLTQIYFDSD
jgi:hypothetical protein